MWTWASWSSGQGRGEEKEETKKQQNMAGRQRQPRGAGYYQRSRTEELPPKASETAAMDKGKVKPPSGAIREGGISNSQQQVGDEDVGEDWEKVEREDLEKLQVVLPLLLLFTSVIRTYGVEVHVSTYIYIYTTYR